MAPKVTKLSFLTPALYWQIGLGVLVLLSIVLAVVIWMSGSGETKEAFKEGRRFIIKLDTGTIEGKIAAAEPPTPAPTVTPAPSPAPESTPASTEKPGEKPTPTPESSPAPTPEATPSPTPQSSEQPAESPTPTVKSSMELPAPLAAEENAPIVPAKVALPPVREDLSEKTDAGTIPKVASDGTKPWQYYAKPYERKGSLPMIAIIVTGLGESKSASESAARLPADFSLSFSPYAKDVDNWIKTARIAGHEAFLDLPLEPANYPATDPGPYGLLASKSDETPKRLQWLMARGQGYAGFVTPQNEAFSADTESFKALLKMLADRGVLLVVGHEPAKGETKQLLEAGTFPSITADTLIDEDLSASAIQARLSALEQTAKTRGYAVGIARAYPVTIQQLNRWAAKLSEDGYVLVPVTFIVHLRFS